MLGKRLDIYGFIAQWVEQSAVCLTLLDFMKKSMNSKQKGNITELETMLAFIKLGYNVLTPYGDCERYDYVVDANGKFLVCNSTYQTVIVSGKL